jgi:hypothetical protein
MVRVGRVGGAALVDVVGRLGSTACPDLVFEPAVRQFFEGAGASRALGFNIAGAMAGGLLENLSLVLGYQNLVLIVALAYGCVLALKPAAN